MEEKKRVRPTVAQVKALTEECERLKNEAKESLEREKEIVSKIRVLEQSNSLIGEEIERLRKENKRLSLVNSSLNKEIQLIKCRGFWARVFNRY